MRLKVTTLTAAYADINEMLQALRISPEQIATAEVAEDAGVKGRFIAQDDKPGVGIVIWSTNNGSKTQAVGTRHLQEGDKVVWFDPTLPQT